MLRPRSARSLTALERVLLALILIGLLAAATAAALASRTSLRVQTERSSVIVRYLTDGSALPPNVPTAFVVEVTGKLPGQLMLLVPRAVPARTQETGCRVVDAPRSAHTLVLCDTATAPVQRLKAVLDTTRLPCGGSVEVFAYTRGLGEADWIAAPQGAWYGSVRCGREAPSSAASQESSAPSATTSPLPSSGSAGPRAASRP